MNFNPFRKRKEAERKKRDAAWAAREKYFDDAIGKAGKITDPAQKILALRNVRQELREQFLKNGLDLWKEAKRKGNKAFLAGGGTTLAGGATLSILSGPIGIGLMISAYGALIGGTVVADARRTYVIKQLEKAVAGHKDALRAKMEKIENTMETVTRENVKEIALSPLLEDVVKDARLAQVFAAAAAKRIEESERSPEATEEQGKDAKKSSDIPALKDAYDKIIKAMYPQRGEASDEKPPENKRPPQKDAPKNPPGGPGAA